MLSAPVIRREFKRPVGSSGAKEFPILSLKYFTQTTRSSISTQNETIYAQEGVDEYWVIDPQSKEISIYQFDEISKDL